VDDFTSKKMRKNEAWVMEKAEEWRSKLPQTEAVEE